MVWRVLGMAQKPTNPIIYFLLVFMAWRSQFWTLCSFFLVIFEREIEIGTMQWFKVRSLYLLVHTLYTVQIVRKKANWIEFKRREQGKSERVKCNSLYSPWLKDEHWTIFRSGFSSSRDKIRTTQEPLALVSLWRKGRLCIAYLLYHKACLS